MGGTWNIRTHKWPIISVTNFSKIHLSKVSIFSTNHVSYVSSFIIVFTNNNNDFLLLVNEETPTLAEKLIKTNWANLGPITLVFLVMWTGDTSMWYQMFK